MLSICASLKALIGQNLKTITVKFTLHSTSDVGIHVLNFLEEVMHSWLYKLFIFIRRCE